MTNTYSYTQNNDVTGDINVYYSKVYSNEGPVYTPNLNFVLPSLTSFKLNFNELSSPVLNISITLNKLDECQTTTEIYKHIHNRQFINTTFYSSYPGYTIFTCQEQRKWSGFQSYLFDDCPNQYAKLLITEFQNVPLKAAQYYGFFTQETDTEKEYICLGFHLDDTDLDNDLVNPYYYDRTMDMKFISISKCYIILYIFL